MRTRSVLFLAVTLIIAGCVPSLHSIVTEKTLTYDPALVGKWQADDAVWTITGNAEDKSYDVEILEKEDKKSKLKAQLVELQGHRFLDMVADDGTQLNTGDWFNAHILPVHNFWKIEKKDAGYVIYDMKYETVQSVIKDKPETIKHEVVGDNRIVLTDSAENLQKFLIAGLTIKDFYTEAVELKPSSD
jgi:hypothetical protein